MKKNNIILLSSLISLLSVQSAYADNFSDSVGMVLGPLGKIFLGIIYIIVAILIGLTMAKRGTFANMMKDLGEEDRFSEQTANIIGIAAYVIVVAIIYLLGKALLS